MTKLLKSASVGESSILLISRNSSEANISLLNRLLSSVKLIEFDHLIAIGIANLLAWGNPWLQFKNLILMAPY